MVYLNKITISLCIAMLVIALSFFLWLWGKPMSHTEQDNIFSPNQTSASMMIKFAQKQLEESKQGQDSASQELKEQRFVILYDLYIKARSYAILNKIFFWISLPFAIAVLLWPSLSVAFSYEWLKSAVVQTTVTGIAVLAFTFYSQYKDKQTYTENLMRYALFSKEDIETLSEKVIDEISKIDKGFSFSSLIKKDKQ